VPARPTRLDPRKTSPAAATTTWGATPPGMLRPAPTRPPAASQQLNTSTTAQHIGVNQRRRGEAQARPSCRNPNHSRETISSHRRWIRNPVGGEVVSMEAIVCFKGRRRRSPEVAGILRRRRRPWSQEELGVERGVSEVSDWVGLIDPVPVRLG
jgi:hypothetical protein